jgi:hypothetical protein
MSAHARFSQKNSLASLCATYKVAREGSRKLATVSPEMDHPAGSTARRRDCRFEVFALMLTCRSRQEVQNTALAMRPLLQRLIKLPLSRVSVATNQPRAQSWLCVLWYRRL